MNDTEEFEVFVLSVRKPLPGKDATEEELTAFGRLTLKPLSHIREVMIETYGGPEYEEDGFYCREWALRGKRRTIKQVFLNPEIFTLRSVQDEKEFFGKYKDFALTPDKIDPANGED